MPIVPLPQFEADLAADAEAYARLNAPRSIVVRFGAMKMVGEFPSDTGIKPGCGSKLVARTHRGTELCEMLTTTCPNSGCGKSVSRDALLSYIENSGGKDYPFFTEGRILRVATVEDLNQQAALEAQAEQWVRTARAAAVTVGLTTIKIVNAEPLLGGERITFHFLSEERIDFRPLVMELARHFHTRVEMHQVGARDEARIVADYERCGQHCCCKQFLKVLKPVSMKAAKTQKATLDPLKISGRCGRLMCCLRYEENTYDELKKNLPRKKTAILTPDGPGIVIDSQILTQLVLVRLDATNEDAAYPVETLKRLQDGVPPPPDTSEDDEPLAGDGGVLPRGPAGPGLGGQGQQGRPSGDSPRNDRGQQRGPGGNGGGGQPSRGARSDQHSQSRGGQSEQGRKGQNQPRPQQGNSGQQRPPLTEEERARKRSEKLIPRSEFRTEDDGRNPGSPPPGQPER